MADVELHSATSDFENPVEAVLETGDATSEAHEEHAASDVVDQEPNAQVEPETLEDNNVEADATPDDKVKDADGYLQEATQPRPEPESDNTPTESVPAAKAEAAKKTVTSKGTSAAGKDKLTISTKNPSGKTNPSTPTVKKVLNSGTFGSGAAKAAPPGKATTTTTTTSSTLSKSTSAAPSTVRKSTSASNANPPAKTTTMASSRAPPSGPPPPSRRSSMLPPRAPSVTGPPTPKSRTSTMLTPLTSSTSSRPPPAEANASSRPSVVSPASSVTSLRSNATGAAPPLAPRPRATLSDAVKRTLSSRQSLPAAPAPPQSRTMRPVGSISSIREVRDDGKALEDLQEKLKEANENLSSKSDAVAVLEANVSELESSLSAALADVKAKTSSLEQLQIAKRSSDAEFSEIMASLQQLRAEHAHNLASLNSVKEELKNAKEATASQTELVETLQAHIQTLTADIVAAQENFESLRASSDQSSAEASAAAQMEREAFVRAKADIETITTEAASLRAEYNRALQDAAARLLDSQQHAAEVAVLNAQIGDLRAEREESATKISELEVEILELKESQEDAEDEHKQVLDRLYKVEAELAEAVAALQQAIDDARAKETEDAQKAADAALLHADEVQLVKDDHAKVVARVEALTAELSAAHTAHSDTEAAARAVAEAHELEMEEAEQSYLSKHIELSEEIKRLSADLESQEAKYNAELDAVKAEHDQLLQEAFERAKAEAGETHGQDLQALRAESQASIEQLRAAHLSAVDALQAEHEAALESQVGDLEKRLNNQALELRATQDDLSKAKAALDASRTEIESMNTQLEDARASLLSACASADQATEIERLAKELANLRDENTMLNDVLAVTKESLSEMSANHTKELEEGARSRVEEVTRLRSTHEGEISILAAQKSELALSLSDLEGEIATLKAQLAAVEPAVAPKSNGTVPVSALTVTREELQKVHDAHNLKMHDMQAEHDRLVRALRVEVDALQTRLDEVQQDVTRKSMEIQYLEQEHEESQDSITRYVKVFGLQSLFGVVIALAVIFDFI
ncbi:hypothetical protein BDN67DRAFT_960954 [Paxillus ammoniavirescens]|nr:hypothetical protein BDN67DRAFT_960954 [Paxillus ammoniavirescens]